MSTPLLESRQRIYIALEELNFVWDEDNDIPIFQKMWKAGNSIQEIADHFERDPDEVLLLAIDQAKKGKIKQRLYGLLGEGR